MTLALTVTSSPWIIPSPRVIAVVKSPFSYLKAIERPSILYSTIKTGSTKVSCIDSTNSWTSSLEKTSCKESIGTRCLTKTPASLLALPPTC